MLTERNGLPLTPPPGISEYENPYWMSVVEEDDPDDGGEVDVDEEDSEDEDDDDEEDDSDPNVS